MGRNYDFKLDTSAMLVYCTPPNGYKSVAFAALDNISANTPDESMKKKLATLTSPFICLDGMNEKGVSIAVLTPAYYTAVSTAKLEQRSFCSAQNPTSFGVKLAYGVVSAGNSQKEKARNFSVYQEVSGFALLKLEIYYSIGFIVGTGQGRLTNGFIFLYKPIHAASFFLLPYVTLRNSPQLTGNLV